MYGERKLEVCKLNDEIVKQYEEFYKHLWKISDDIHEMVNRLVLEINNPNATKLMDFEKQCLKAESKLDLDKDYGNIFGLTDRDGYSFFKKVCSRISEGGEYCFALDRAATKKGSLWTGSWDDPPYQDFKKASIEAAKIAGTTFRRLFVLESKASQGDRDKVVQFIESIVECFIPY